MVHPMFVSNQPKVVLLSGNGLRHRYVAVELAKSSQLVGVVSEGKAPIIAHPEQLPPDDLDVINKHLGQRDEAERRMFGTIADFPQPCLAVLHGQSNSDSVFDWVRRLEPDFLVMYGTSIIKDPLLSAYVNKVVNLHLGLSPYYRGTATNFWPLVYGEPECVGATIHLAVLKVDAGPILAQVRPQAEREDGAHELGCKTIAAAAQTLPKALSLLASGQLKPRTQNLAGGRLCRRKDFTAEAVRKMWGNFESGMMSDFVAHAKQRTGRYPIVEAPQ